MNGTGDVRNLQALGVRPDDFLEPLPELSPRARLAVACWNFCAGWAPERWPMFGALHDVDDWGALMRLMQAIRDAERAAREATN